MDQTLKDKLKENRINWLKLFDHLQNEDSFKGQIAGPFFSIEPEENSKPRILYVGKATDGSWDARKVIEKKSDHWDERLHERTDCTRSELGCLESKKTDSRAFWRLMIFFRAKNYETIWSNICKIGAESKNPNSGLVAAQKDLAIETILIEIECYKPMLVYFVTNDFVEEILNEIRLKITKCDWNKHPDIGTAPRSPATDVEWINGTETHPAFLWTQHPQGKGKTNETLNRWTEIAECLVDRGDVCAFLSGQ